MKAAQTACRSHTTPEWFIPWFNSVHYQKLYAHRDEAEAARFVDQLVDRLRPGPDATMLDLACGTGRHARRLGVARLSRPGVSMLYQAGAVNVEGDLESGSRK